MLGRLALHYYRPDFTPAQQKLVFDDFVTDLMDYPLVMIAEAVRQYRISSENKFFPTPGAIVDLIDQQRSWMVAGKAERLRSIRAEGAIEMEQAVTKQHLLLAARDVDGS